MAVFESKSRLRPKEGRVHMLLRPKPWKYALGLGSQFLSPSPRAHLYDFSLVIDSGACGLMTWTRLSWSWFKWTGLDYNTTLWSTQYFTLETTILLLYERNNLQMCSSICSETPYKFPPQYLHNHHVSLQFSFPQDVAGPICTLIKRPCYLV